MAVWVHIQAHADRGIGICMLRFRFSTIMEVARSGNIVSEYENPDINYLRKGRTNL